MNYAVVIMGVAGCGKSSLGGALAQALGGTLVEGDDFHSPHSRDKMRQGMALTDEDRAQWLDRLAQQLQDDTRSVVLSCSALRLPYRQRLRTARADLRFVFLDITPTLAQHRVAARGSAHFFSSTLVDSQFATLESPVGEPAVLRLDASLHLGALLQRTRAWLQTNEETV